MNSKVTIRLNYTQALQRFIKRFLYIVTLYYIALMVFIWPFIGSPSYLMFLVSLTLQLFSIVVVHVVPFEYLKKLYPVYILIITGTIFLSTVEVGGFSYLWFFVAGLGIYILYPGRKMKPWAIYLCVLYLTARILSFVLISHDIHVVSSLFFNGASDPLSPTSAFLSGSLTLGFACGLFLYILYYLHKLHQVQVQALYESLGNKEEAKDLPDNTDEQKYKELSAQIENYLETEQPFLNPDFDRTQLALALNTNIAYISKAIHLRRDVNFCTLVNYYRIEKVKQMMQDSSDKYTFEYIATAAGFRNLSTFNKAFKEIEGLTPSAYSKKLNKT